MAGSNKPAKAVKENVKGNVLHLDRDPNDPRNVPPAKALPSLDDEDQK